MPAKSTRNPAVFGAVGLLLTLAAAGFVVMKSGVGIPSGDAAQPTLTYVAQSEIGAAAVTLTPASAAALVDDAQRCKIPLVSMTIEKGTAAIGSTIRIRSGSAVQFEFLSRPLGNNADRRCGRKAVPLGQAVEVDLDANAFAFVDVHVPMAMEFENFNR